MHYLIAGLGNVGAAYDKTRHNIGFRVLDAMAARHEASFALTRLAYTSHLSYRGRKVTLLKPTTYMNDSGRAIRYGLEACHVPVSRLLVITDDLHLPFGKLRLRMRGSHAGHNGLRDIIDVLNTSQYARLRFGIDRRFHPGQQSDYVLAPFTKEEEQSLPSMVDEAVDMALSFCWRGPADTMQRYNR